MTDNSNKNNNISVRESICSRDGCNNFCHHGKDYCDTCLKFISEYNEGKFTGGALTFSLASLQGMTWVYFIEMVGHDFIKIGRAKDVQSRLSSIQSSNPYKLELIASFFFFGHAEKMLHEMFAEHRERGEWFRKNDDLMSFIDEINSGRIPEYMQHPGLSKEAA